MSVLTIALVKVAVLAAVAAVAGSEPTARGGPRAWKVEGLPDSKAVGAEPVTLRVAPDADLTKALTAAVDDGKATVRLNLSGLDLDPKVGVKVFVNVPAGDTLPAADSDHYVGMVGAFGKTDKADYAVDLAPALRKLAAKKKWASGDPISIRLVAAPISPRQPIRDQKATLDRVSVEIPAGPN